MKKNNGSAYLMLLAAMLTLTLWVAAAIVVTSAGRAVSMRYPPYGGMYDLSVAAIHMLYDDLRRQAAAHHDEIMAILHENTSAAAIDGKPRDWFTREYRQLISARLQNGDVNYQLELTEERPGGLHTDTYIIEGTQVVLNPIISAVVSTITSEVRLDGDSVFLAEALVVWPELPHDFVDEILLTYEIDEEGVKHITSFEFIYQLELLTLELTRLQRVLE